MLTKAEALFRLAVAVTLFLLSGTQTVTGAAATVCGVLGTIELATALVRYSPMMELFNHYPSLTRFITLRFQARKKRPKTLP